MPPGDSTQAGAGARGLSMRDALQSVMRVHNIPVVYVDSDVDDWRVAAACGRCSPEQALDSLLAGTDLIWMKIGDQYLVTRPGRLGRHVPAILSGRVEEAETRRPLENAVVFFAGTTIGTSTGAGGVFKLPVTLVGAVDLVVSLVGYESRVLRIDAEANNGMALTIPLVPRTIEQDTVVVPGARRPEWERDFADFQKAFIGTGECAEGCRLLNPWVIELSRRGDTLVAWSDSLIWMENVLLGYRMCGILRTFEWDIARDRGEWLMHVFFRDLPPESPDERLEWNACRRRLYRGSLVHFLRACVNGRVEGEGFEIRSGERLQFNARWRVIPGDSMRMTPHPGARSLEFRYPRWLRVDALAYGWNHAFVRVEGPFALVDSTGALENPLSVKLGGRWADDRAGSLLPLDYVLEESP